MNEAICNKKIQKIIQQEKLTQYLWKMERFTHHKDVSTMWHCIAVAYYSMWIASMLPIKVRSKSMIIGALFHDYYLYDWHRPEKYHRFHGFRHSRFAVENLRKQYTTNAIEENIILSHMFPLTWTPPLYRESIIVSMADKWCSIQETIFSNTHQELRQTLKGAIFRDYLESRQNRKDSQ